MLRARLGKILMYAELETSEGFVITFAGPEQLSI